MNARHNGHISYFCSVKLAAQYFNAILLIAVVVRHGASEKFKIHATQTFFYGIINSFWCTWLAFFLFDELLYRKQKRSYIIGVSVQLVCIVMPESRAVFVMG